MQSEFQLTADFASVLFQYTLHIASVLDSQHSSIRSQSKISHQSCVCVSLFKEKRVIFPLSCFSLFVPSLAAVDEEDKNILARKTCERIQFSAEEDSWVN